MSEQPASFKEQILTHSVNATMLSAAMAAIYWMAMTFIAPMAAQQAETNADNRILVRRVSDSFDKQTKAIEDLSASMNDVRNVMSSQTEIIGKIQQDSNAERELMASLTKSQETQSRLYETQNELLKAIHQQTKINAGLMTEIKEKNK